METFFKPGDVVTVRHDLLINRSYKMGDGITEDYSVDSMTQFFGHRVTIASNNYGKYEILEDCRNCWWTDEMFVEFMEDSVFDPPSSAEILRLLKGA